MLTFRHSNDLTHDPSLLGAHTHADSSPSSLWLVLVRARLADFPGYHSPDRALVGDEERTAHAMAQKRLNEAKAKPTR